MLLSSNLILCTCLTHTYTHYPFKCNPCRVGYRHIRKTNILSVLLVCYVKSHYASAWKKQFDMLAELETLDILTIYGHSSETFKTAAASAGLSVQSVVNISVYKDIIRHVFQSQSYFKGLLGEILLLSINPWPLPQSLLITFQIQSTGNKQQQYRAEQLQKLVQR